VCIYRRVCSTRMSSFARVLQRLEILLEPSVEDEIEEKVINEDDLVNKFANFIVNKIIDYPSSYTPVWEIIGEENYRDYARLKRITRLSDAQIKDKLSAAIQEKMNERISDILADFYERFMVGLEQAGTNELKKNIENHSLPPSLWDEQVKQNSKTKQDI
jgi:hypothetical protein